MSAIKAPDPRVAVGARRGRWRGMAELARNAPNRHMRASEWPAMPAAGQRAPGRPAASSMPPKGTWARSHMCKAAAIVAGGEIRKVDKAK